MVCKNRGVYGFLYPSWVLINVAPRNSFFGWLIDPCANQKGKITPGKGQEKRERKRKGTRKKIEKQRKGTRKRKNKNTATKKRSRNRRKRSGMIKPSRATGIAPCAGMPPRIPCRTPPQETLTPQPTWRPS